MDIFFSIIVPVYNVGNYLCECVDSILRQKMQSYEIILVDDGSTDNSGLLCDQYAECNEIIHVIHQINGGLSAARNAGLRCAKGKYVMFVDSDDYIDGNALELLCLTILDQSPDVIGFYGYRFTSNGEIMEGIAFKEHMADRVCSGRTYYGQALYQDRLMVGAQYYVTLLDFINRNGLSFKEGLLHEDELWTPLLLMNAPKVFDLQKRLYYYRCDNTNSITRDPLKQKRRAMNRLEISQLLANALRQFSKSDKDLNCFHDNIAALYMYAVFDGNLYLDNHIDRVFPLRHARTFKYRLKAALFFVSPRLACAIRRLKS